MEVAVYEPGVSIDGSIPMDWMPGYEEKLVEKNYAGAFVEFLIGMGPNYIRKIPRWYMKLLLPLIMSSHERKRSEEHTSELQSPDHLVCRLLLEKKKKYISLLSTQMAYSPRPVCQRNLCARSRRRTSTQYYAPVLALYPILRNPYMPTRLSHLCS